MPRVRSLDPARRKLETLTDFIKRRMKEQNLKQSDLAEAAGMCQQNLSAKLNRGSLRVEELLRIFEKLGVTKEEAGELITL